MKKHKTLIFGILLFGMFFASSNNLLLVNAATCSNWSEAEEDRNASGKTYGGRYTEESETLSEVKKYISSQRNISDPCKSQEDNGKMCEEICTGTPTDAEIKQLGGGNFVKPEDTDTEKYSYSRVWGDDTYCYYVVTVQRCAEEIPEDPVEISCGKAGQSILLDRNGVAGGLLKQNSWTSRNTTVAGEYFQAFVQTESISKLNTLRGCIYSVNTGTVDKNSPVENGRRSIINQFSTKNNSMTNISDSLMIYQCTTAVTNNSSDCDQSTNEGKTARKIADAIWSVFSETAKDKIHDKATLDAVVKKLGSTKVSDNIIKNVLSGYAGFKYNADDYDNSFEFDIKDRKLNGKTGTATIVVKPKAANAKLNAISFYKGSGIQNLTAAEKSKRKLQSVAKVSGKEYEITIPDLNSNAKDCEKVTVTIELSYLGTTSSYVISYIDTPEGHRYYLALKNSNDVVAASTTEFSFYMSDECDQLIGEENVVCFDGTDSEYAKYKAGKVSGYSLTKYCCGKSEAKSKMGSDFEKVCNVCFDGAESHKAKYKENPTKYKDVYASCCSREDAKDNMGADYNALCNVCFDGAGSLKSQYHENPTAVAGAYAGCCTDPNAKDKMGNIVYNRLCNNTVCENDTDENICKEESDNGFIYEVKPTDGEPGSGKGVNNYVCLTEGKDSNGNTYEEFIFKGNPYCSVYCKEDIETYFQGFGYNPRTGLNILSGQYFEFKPFGEQSNLPAINQTRNCVYKTDEGLLNRDIYGQSETPTTIVPGGLYGQAVEYLEKYYDIMSVLKRYEAIEESIETVCKPVADSNVETNTPVAKETKKTNSAYVTDITGKYTASLSATEKVSAYDYNLKKYNNLVATTTRDDIAKFESIYDVTDLPYAKGCAQPTWQRMVHNNPAVVEYMYYPNCCNSWAPDPTKDWTNVTLTNVPKGVDCSQYINTKYALDWITFRFNPNPQIDSRNNNNIINYTDPNSIIASGLLNDVQNIIAQGINESKLIGQTDSERKCVEPNDWPTNGTIIENTDGVYASICRKKAADAGIPYNEEYFYGSDGLKKRKFYHNNWTGKCVTEEWVRTCKTWSETPSTQTPSTQTPSTQTPSTQTPKPQTNTCHFQYKLNQCTSCSYSAWKDSDEPWLDLNITKEDCHGTHIEGSNTGEELKKENAEIWEYKYSYRVWDDLTNEEVMKKFKAENPTLPNNCHISSNKEITCTFVKKSCKAVGDGTFDCNGKIQNTNTEDVKYPYADENRKACRVIMKERTCSGKTGGDKPGSKPGGNTILPCVGDHCTQVSPSQCEIYTVQLPGIQVHLGNLRKEAADLRERYLKIVAEINRAKDMYQQCVKYGDEKRNAYAESDYPKIDDFWYQEMDIASPEVRKILEKIELERKSLDVGTTDLEYCKGEGGSLKNCSKTSNYTDKTIPILKANLEDVGTYSNFNSYINAHKISSETIRFYEFAKNEAHANVSYGIGTEMYSLKPSGLTVTKDDPAFKLAEANKTYDRLGYGLPISITTSYGKYDYSFVIANLGKNNRMLKAFEDLNDDSKYTCKYFVTPFVVCPPDGCKLIPTASCPPGSEFNASCYTDGTGTMTNPKLQPYSRQIDTNNINVNDRTLGEPWNTEKGKAAQERIANENLDSQVPMYTFILTPEDIKQIKENTKVNGYSKFEMTCDDNGRCISPFVEEFGEDSIVQAGRKVWIEYVNGKFEIVTD